MGVWFTYYFALAQTETSQALTPAQLDLQEQLAQPLRGPEVAHRLSTKLGCFALKVEQGFALLQPGGGLSGKTGL